jgi:hypothetical protein
MFLPMFLAALMSCAATLSCHVLQTGVAWHTTQDCSLRCCRYQDTVTWFCTSADQITSACFMQIGHRALFALAAGPRSLKRLALSEESSPTLFDPEWLIPVLTIGSSAPRRFHCREHTYV